MHRRNRIPTGDLCRTKAGVIPVILLGWAKLSKTPQAILTGYRRQEGGIVDRGSWIVDRGSWIVNRGSWLGRQLRLERFIIHPPRFTIHHSRSAINESRITNHQPRSTIQKSRLKRYSLLKPSPK